MVNPSHYEDDARIEEGPKLRSYQRMGDTLERGAHYPR